MEPRLQHFCFQVLKSRCVVSPEQFASGLSGGPQSPQSDPPRICRTKLRFSASDQPPRQSCDIRFEYEAKPLPSVAKICTSRARFSGGWPRVVGPYSRGDRDFCVRHLLAAHEPGFRPLNTPTENLAGPYFRAALVARRASSIASRATRSTSSTAEHKCSSMVAKRFSAWSVVVLMTSASSLLTTERLSIIAPFAADVA
jgi:hypothetical protein